MLLQVTAPAVALVPADCRVYFALTTVLGYCSARLVVPIEVKIAPLWVVNPVS